MNIRKKLGGASRLIRIYNPVSLVHNRFFTKEKSFAPRRPRKRRDTTKLTQYMYDFIIEAHRQFLVWNNTAKERGVKRLTGWDLTDKINEQLGTNKSRTALARVWSGKIDRDMLPKGTPIVIRKDDK